MTRPRGRHLYRDGAEAAELREFKREYGPRLGPRYYGAFVGKVRRERLERAHAHAHSGSHHAGPCDTACRRGRRAHRHRGYRVVPRRP